MAEMCLDCLNRYSGTSYTKADVELGSKDYCEGCGEWKRVVVTICRPGWNKDTGRVHKREIDKDSGSGVARKV